MTATTTPPASRHLTLAPRPEPAEAHLSELVEYSAGTAPTLPTLPNENPPRRPESWAILVGHWVEWMRAAGTPRTTINLRRYYITRLASDHPDVLTLSVDDLATWLGAAEWQPNTRKSARSALRSFFHWALVTNRVTASAAHQLPGVRVPRGRPRPAPEQAYKAALAAAANDPRARLALELAGRCGLRRSEIAKAHVHDIELETDGGHALRVKGKGGHVRLVPLPADLASRILDTLDDGWLFPSMTPTEPLSSHHLAKIAGAYLPQGVSLHSLRHRCATTAYAATRDLRAVQELLGHSRPETTAGYVQLPDQAVRAAMLAAAGTVLALPTSPQQPSVTSDAGGPGAPVALVERLCEHSRHTVETGRLHAGPAVVRVQRKCPACDTPPRRFWLCGPGYETAQSLECSCGYTAARDEFWTVIERVDK